MIAERTHRRADAPGLSDADWQSPAITAGLTAHASLVARFEAKRPIRFRYQNAELIIDVVPPLAQWVMPTARALVELLALQRGWDSYGAPRIDPRSVEAAMNILLELMQVDSPYPSVVPTSAGGVQMEWHINGVDLEIEVNSPTRIIAAFEDQRTSTSWEANVTANLDELAAVMAKLSKGR